MSKIRGGRLENEVQKCRAECNWSRLRDLLDSISAKNSGIEYMSQLLHAEVLLESFIDQQSAMLGGYLRPDSANREPLHKAKLLLIACFDAATAAAAGSKASLSTTNQQYISLESHLLLAKLEFMCADYQGAIVEVDNSGLERDVPFVTLRTLRLVAEAYAIKGLSMEHLVSINQSRSDATANRRRILFCFEKSAELAMSYVLELEKSINSTTGIAAPLITTPNSSLVPMSTLSCDKIGELLETALQRVPLMQLNRSGTGGDNSIIDNCGGGVEWYRRIMTVFGDKPMAQHMQQKLSRQLAEVLMRGTSDSSYSSQFDSNAVGKKKQSLRFYTGSSKTYFCPESRLEEVLLSLIVSETLAARDAVLSRSDDDAIARHRSILNVKAVHNLLTLVLSTLHQYQLLAGFFEKAMKFAYEDRFIWMQFGLTLMCQGSSIRCARLLNEQLLTMSVDSTDDDKCLLHMFAAKLDIEQLAQYDSGIEHARQAIELCRGGWLTVRAKLLYALATSLKAQTLNSCSQRSALQRESLLLFEDAARSDPKDHLVELFWALQLAIVRDIDNARVHCQRSLELQSDEPAAIMLLALLLTADGGDKHALELVVDALDDYPKHYGLLVLRLKLEARFGRVDHSLSTARDLLVFWKNAADLFVQYGSATTADPTLPPSQQKMPPSESGPAPPTSSSFANVAAIALSNSHVLSSTAYLNTSSFDVTDKDSVLAASTAPLSEYGGAASTISDSIGFGSASSAQRAAHARFRVQANIWLELAELFFDLGRLSDVYACIEEACRTFPNSHQALYLKGRLLAGRADEVIDEDEQQQQHKARLYSEAKACLLGALSIFPNHIPSLRHLANIYRNERNLRMAEKMLRDLVVMEPLNYDSWQSLGCVLAESGRNSQAIECFSMASAVQSTTPIIPFTVIPRVIHL